MMESWPLGSPSCVSVIPGGHGLVFGQERDVAQCYFARFLNFFLSLRS